MNNKIYNISEIKDLVAPIAKQHGVDRMWIFGSYARGDAT
jgi:predicted nucleotidyltransferase